MNHCVPDFEFDDEYSIPTSSVPSRPRKPVMAEDDVMELLWQNGEVVLQSQNQRSHKKSAPSNFDGAAILPDQSAPPREITSLSHHHHQQQQPEDHHHQQQQPEDHHLFMQEDEMASWLHYPLNETNFDSDFCADLVYNNNNNTNNPAPSVTSTAATASTTTGTGTATYPARATHMPESRQQQLNTSTVASATRPLIPLPPRRTGSFGHFSKHTPAMGVSGPSNPNSAMMTVVNSNDIPAVAPESKVSEARRSAEGASGVNNRCGNISGAGATRTSSGGGDGSGVARDLATCELMSSLSPGSEATSAEPPAHKPPAEDRKRKGMENDDEYHSEDVELESADVKKQTRGSTSTKRSRAAEVHNLSERRRRDRINEKMRALQELIPRCNKSDKASMLDEAIEYLKSLQMQVQMMSMGCGMVPMMFPGVQQYMPNLGMGMGMGMGMDMGMNRPMMAFPNMLSASAMPTPATAAHVGPRFPMPPFHMPTGPGPVPSRVQAANQPDPMFNSLVMQNPNQPRAPNFVDPFQQQYLALHQMHAPRPQNQSMVQPNASQPSNSRGAENFENRPLG